MSCTIVWCIQYSLVTSEVITNWLWAVWNLFRIWLCLFHRSSSSYSQKSALKGEKILPTHKTVKMYFVLHLTWHSLRSFIFPLFWLGQLNVYLNQNYILKATIYVQFCLIWNLICHISKVSQSIFRILSHLWLAFLGWLATGWWLQPGPHLGFNTGWTLWQKLLKTNSEKCECPFWVWDIKF